MRDIAAPDQLQQGPRLFFRTGGTFTADEFEFKPMMTPSTAPINEWEYRPTQRIPQELCPQKGALRGEIGNKLIESEK